jgi:hypothetical protein
MSVFGSVVAGAFQIAFRVEIYANDVFLFLTSAHQNDPKIQTALNFNKKKNSNLNKTQVQTFSISGRRRWCVVKIILKCKFNFD